MTNYWPEDIDIDDTGDPQDILLEAKDQWYNGSGGRLELVVQEAESKSGNKMLIVHAKHNPSNRTVTLFSVVHRPEQPYPARIQPKDVDIPNSLKKEYYKPGVAEVVNHPFEGKCIVNKWVCYTPTEYRQNLEKVFNLGFVKAEIISLVSTFNQSDSDKSSETNDSDEQPNKKDEDGNGQSDVDVEEEPST